MATIIYTDFPLDISEGTQGSIWRRPFRVDGIVATDRTSALAEIFLALPDRGTSVPAPLNPNMRVIENRVTWLGELDGANGEAKGVTTNSTPVDSITAAPPEAGAPDTGPGITLSSRGYIQQRTWGVARRQGSASVTNVEVQNSDGLYTGVEIAAPAFGEQFTFSRTEETNPRQRVKPLLGRINNATWNGYAVDTVVLQNYISESVNGGEYYNVTYDFVAFGTSDGWAVTVTGKDLEKGGAPIQTPVGDQRTFWIPYDRADFGPLNIVLD